MVAVYDSYSKSPIYPTYKWREPHFKVKLITSNNTHQTHSSNYFTYQSLTKTILRGTSENIRFYHLPVTLKEWNLRLPKKMSDQQDITCRIGQATQACGLMHKIWLSNRHITNNSKIRIYNACIKPILMFNTSAMAATQKITEKLNITRRKHLRHLLNIFYPLTIPNKDLNRITKQQTISLQLTESRWNISITYYDNTETPLQKMLCTNTLTTKQMTSSKLHPYQIVYLLN
jgi:hypothetical protein